MNLTIAKEQEPISTTKMSVSVAYLFNWYPQPSPTALRREVTALEDLGLSPHRFTMRPFKGQLVDENDLSEREKDSSFA